MLNDPHVVGFDRAFDWWYVEDHLGAPGTKYCHTVLTFAVHYPGQPLSLPGHLKNSTNAPLQ